MTPSATIRRREGIRGLPGHALLVWLALLVFAVVNGLFRERFLEPGLGDEIAHFLSTTTLCGAVIVAALLFVGNYRRALAPRELFIVGLLWSTSTVVFETVFGLAAGRRSVSELFRDYDVFRGRLFAFVVLTEIAAPPVAGWLRRWAERRSDGSSYRADPE